MLIEECDDEIVRNSEITFPKDKMGSKVVYS